MCNVSGQAKGSLLKCWTKTQIFSYAMHSTFQFGGKEKKWRVCEEKPDCTGRAGSEESDALVERIPLDSMVSLNCTSKINWAIMMPNCDLLCHLSLQNAGSFPFLPMNNQETVKSTQMSDNDDDDFVEMIGTETKEAEKEEEVTGKNIT